MHHALLPEGMDYDRVIALSRAFTPSAARTGLNLRQSLVRRDQ